MACFYYGHSLVPMGHFLIQVVQVQIPDVQKRSLLALDVTLLVESQCYAFFVGGDILGDYFRERRNSL